MPKDIPEDAEKGYLEPGSIRLGREQGYTCQRYPYRNIR